MASYRKHYSILTVNEKEFLWRKLYDVGSENWKATNHLLEALFNRGGNHDEIVNTIYNGQIIEYHQKDNRNRILVRGTRLFHGSVMCIVFEPDTKSIITAYWNTNSDKHKTIDMSAYIDSLDILPSWEKQQLVVAS